MRGIRWLTRWILLGGLTLAWLLGAGARAMPIELVDSPQNTTAPFKHNVFHEASGAGGANGDILAWLDLDETQGAANFYDPDTGALEALFDLFESSALTTGIGTARASGTSLLASTLSDANQTNVVVGTIDWTIDLSSSMGSVLEGYLESSLGDEADDIWNVTMSFADVLYVTSPQGRTPNSVVGDELALWGADGDFIGSDAGALDGPGGMGGFGTSANLGVDLVVQGNREFVLPEPGAGLLLVTGLAGLALAGRKR